MATSSAKVLQLLRLFKAADDALRASEVPPVLHVSLATAYRYLAELEHAGMVERIPGGRYVLGPEIVELDRVVRATDPLVAASREVMKALAERTGGLVLLARLHRQRVVCVHHERGRDGPSEVSYARGRAMPLFRGATSKVVLAHLARSAPETVAALVSQHGAELEAAGLPSSWPQLERRLARLREQKLCTSAAEVDPGVRGWAVAIHQGPRVLGSLSVVLWEEAADRVDAEHLGDHIARAALRIQGRLDARW